ncbi:hypothetical protein FHP76_002574 [Enterococcus faecium]|nr:hypothetical protein [Enterococcus faecium]EGP5559778.1 hypothetical protein [Enterococcus faecium]EME8104829.1 hypothetical protein [Enterococcus faecium]
MKKWSKWSGLMVVGTMLSTLAMSGVTTVLADDKIDDAGSGSAQVHYVGNKADTDVVDPTFSVIIPTYYQLTNKQKLAEGQVKMVKFDDASTAYDGETEINIKIASAHGDHINDEADKYLGFEGNDGRYTLVGDDRDYLTQGFSDANEENTFAKGFYMHKDVTRKTLNAKLTKLSSNNVSAGTDTLTFNYSVTSID